MHSSTNYTKVEINFNLDWLDLAAGFPCWFSNSTCDGHLVRVVDDGPGLHGPVLGVQPAELGRGLCLRLTREVGGAGDVAVELAPDLVIQPLGRLWGGGKCVRNKLLFYWYWIKYQIAFTIGKKKGTPSLQL